MSNHGTFEVGQSIRFRALFEASSAPATYAGTPTYVATTPTTSVLTVTDPDGADSAPSPTLGTVGYLHASYTIAEEGLHRFRWVGSGSVIATVDGIFHGERPLT